MVPSNIATQILSSGTENFKRRREELIRKRNVSMNLQPMSEAIYQAITQKGHHDIEYSQLETLTFRQIVHLLTEWAEMYEHYQEITRTPRQPEVLAKLHEEGADILIVALDLCGLHQLDVTEVPVDGQPIGVLNTMYSEVPAIIGHLGDLYRKYNRLDQHWMHKLIILVWHLLKRHGADPAHVIQQKMEINMARPQKYGTKEAAA